MPMNAANQITYKPSVHDKKIYYQTDPPVCNICLVEITRATFGWAYFTPEPRTDRQFEIIECTACTAIRENGAALLDFLKRHKL